MNLVTDLHWWILCDQDQALDTFWCLHRHDCGDLSPKAVAEDMSFFNFQSVHCVQYGLGHLDPTELSPIHYEMLPCNLLPCQSRKVSSRVRLLCGRGSGGR